MEQQTEDRMLFHLNSQTNVWFLFAAQQPVRKTSCNRVRRVEHVPQAPCHETAQKQTKGVRAVARSTAKDLVMLFDKDGGN